MQYAIAPFDHKKNPKKVVVADDLLSVGRGEETGKENTVRYFAWVVMMCVVMMVNYKTILKNDCKHCSI